MITNSEASPEQSGTAANTASSIRVVIMLYEQLIKDVQRALISIQQKDVERCSREISHALCVLGELQNAINYDRGGAVAENLDRFYFLLRADLVEAEFKIAPYLLQKNLKSLVDLREIWLQVEHGEKPGSSQSASPGRYENASTWSV